MPRRPPLSSPSWTLGLSALVALVALAACGRKPPPPPPAVRAAPSNVNPSATTTAYAIPEPDLPASCEVEFEGAVKGKVKGARYVVLVSEQPCTTENLGTVPTIAIGEARQKPKGRLYATEGNVREGSRGHVCAVVLDEKGRAVGFGAFAKNPIVFDARGKDELKLEDVDVTVMPVSPPRELPLGRF